MNFLSPMLFIVVLSLAVIFVAFLYFHFDYRKPIKKTEEKNMEETNVDPEYLVIEILKSLISNHDCIKTDCRGGDDRVLVQDPWFTLSVWIVRPLAGSVYFEIWTDKKVKKTFQLNQKSELRSFLKEIIWQNENLKGPYACSD